MKKKADITHIIDCLNSKYGIAATHLTCLPLGADRNALVYKAEAQDCRSYFIKLKYKNSLVSSVTLLAFLEASGMQQIIPPIITIDGKLTQTIGDFTLLVFPFVEGQNGFYYKLTDDQWIQLGKALRHVHELAVPLAIKDQISRETYSAKWREAVRSLDTSIDAILQGDDIALKMQTYLKKHRALIHHLVDRAETLCQEVQKLPQEWVLCHSDIHGGNVLIDRSGAFYLVDWDEAMMAPKERDLLFIGGGIANTWNDPREEELFYQGYGKTIVNRTILAYYRYERIVEDIAEYAQALLFSSDASEDRQEMYKQFTDMFVPNGVVDIAEKTDAR